MRLRLLPVLAVVALVGCSKIHEQRSFTLQPHGGYTLSVTAPVSEQKVSVAVTSNEPINVWILLEKEIPSGDKDDFDPDVNMKSGVLAKEKKAKDVVLQATIPAKEKFQVYLNNPGSKPANVTVKIDSQ